MNPSIELMLKTLNAAIASGALTKGIRVDSDTFIQFTETVRGQNIVSYHQGRFEDLQWNLKKMFLNATLGTRVAQYKIVGIWDVWENKDLLPLPNKHVWKPRH